MQIQRVTEESMGVREEVKGRGKDGLTMKNPKPPADSAASVESTPKSIPPVSEANGSFLHGSDRAKSAANNERSMNDRIVYATIDRLALKRTRLPLQLVPIDDNTPAVEKKEKINGEKRVNANRKTSPRRPSFKVRPGISMSSAQWKSRTTRSSPRSNQAIGKFENVSKELVSRLIIFENIIRNNNKQDCGTFDERATAETGTDQEVPVLLPEAKASRDKHSNVIHLGSLRDSRVNEEIADGAETPQVHSFISPENRDASDSDSPTNRAEESNLEDNGTKDETAAEQSASLSPEEAKRITEENDEFFEPIETDISTSQKHLLESCSTSTSSSSLSSKTKRYKPEFTFAKNVLHYVPISSHTKRTKKSSNSSKNRKNDAKSNLQASKSKSFSREELRHSISLPTNFVHLASATNSQLMPNGETTGNSSGKVITHEEKCAKLRYLGSADYREIEIAKVAGKIVRNSREDRTTYVEIKQMSPLNFTETRHSVGFEETSPCSTSTSSSSSSGDNGDDFDNDVNRAKVSSLENSQGVPEVVKRSENEGNDKYAEMAEEEDATAPVYEAISEFSISAYGAYAPAAAAAKCANASFLWGERASRRFDKETTSGRINDEITPSGHETNVKTDNSIDENGSDAYDDVGLSRDDTEEDHYDDVGLPSTDTKNSSTDTLFEEIDVGGDGELYDDVLPGPINKNSIPSTNSAIGNDNDSAAIKSSNSRAEETSEKVDSPLAKRSSRLSLENVEQESYENQYLSISNDYSSVEEGLDDFEGEEDDGLYDDVELPSQERVNSLYGGSSSGSQLGSLYNGKESEWEDLEEAAPVLPLPKKNNVALRHGDSQAIPSKKKAVQRWSRNVRRQKSKASRKNPASRSTSRAAAAGGASTFSDTASDDSNYETLFSFPSDEFSSGSDDEGSSVNPSSPNGDDSGLQSRVNGICPEAPSRPVPPPPRESSLTETFGKRMKMLRRTWSITKGSLGRMRRRTSTTTETETNVDEGGKYQNCERQQSPNNDGRKYFSFKKHFKKSVPGLSTFYLENENDDGRLSRNNNSSKEEVYSDCSNNSWYTNTDYWKTGVTEHSQRNDVDHYSMLDEEPLYQFYAAAAARVAFESDSEGYEEVEDPTPSPSTVDLAKPGHRTLWSHTPQVISSALLQRLTSDEKKMQEAKFEIFTSEASYLNSLRVLVDEFLNDHELVHEVLTPSEREKLFGGVPSVLIASERLLAELETVWREDVMLRGLPEVLLNYAQRSSSVYVAYCSNQVSIDTTLKELRNKKGSKFEDTVKRIESHPACQSLSLHSFLMLPMQRVTRLPLLADAVLSKVSAENKDERTCWECVLSQFSQVVMECNEGARAAGRLVEMEALERKLEYSSKVPPIILRDRYLVRRGPVVQMLAKADAEYKLTFGKRHHKAPLYLLLLTDYLLIAKRKSNTNEETYTVIDTCKRSLVALEKVTEDSPFSGRHAMVLSLLENYSGRHVEYILTCNSATERERWLDAVSPPKPSLVGETLYETWDCPQVMALYPYAAAQPDELTLQPGDVINVLRKMTDGWHLGEKLLGGEQGWFPGNYAKEVASEHVRARNLRQRHRLLALSASVLQQRAKQTSRLH